MTNKRILVVDDEPSVTRNLKLNLESGGGYDVFAEIHANNLLGAPATRLSRPGTMPSGQRILLVDDDDTVRDSLSQVLVSEGYFVIPAENGQQALDLIARSRAELVLLDLNMPIKNGWDTFERLTAEHPLIPIIIATARPNQLFTALNAGAGALVEKPMDIPALLRTIHKLLAEATDQRLARLAGEQTDFDYQPAPAHQSQRRPAKHREALGP